MKISNFRKNLLLSSSFTLVANIGFAAPVLATDTVISTPTAVTFTLVGAGDSVTVVSGGSISTAAAATYGVSSNVASSKITVSSGGSISTTGVDGRAIFVGGTQAQVLNAGAINTSGQYGHGVYGLGDGAQITNTGAIKTTGNQAHGVNAGGANTVITNSGTIGVADVAYGIYAGGDNTQISNSGTISSASANRSAVNIGGTNSTITNTGTISTTGNSGHGVNLAATGGTAINSGTISTSGAGALGIRGAAGATSATITNSGTIAVTGNGSDGIAVSGINSVVTNSGTISTADTGSDGVELQGAGSRLENSGAITTAGQFSDAVQSFGANVVINNTGVLKANGPDAYGILANGASVRITNSGSISSAQSHALVVTQANGIVTNSGQILASGAAFDAIRITGATPTLNLAAPAFIGGAIETPVNTTLNITTGPSHSVAWTFDPADLVGGAPVVTGTVPAFFNAGTGVFATYDPTALAVAADQLGELTGLISGLSAQKSDATNVWVSGFGSWSQIDGKGTTLGRKIANGGLATGANVHLSGDVHLGGMIGYVASGVTSSSVWTQSLDNRSDGLFANAHGRIDFGDFYAGLGISAGGAENHARRFVNDNLALTGGQTLGQSWAAANYASWWVSPEITIGVTFEAGDGWVLNPSAQIRYAIERIGGFTEAGSNSNATVAGRDVGVIEARAELAVGKVFDSKKVTLRAGVQGRTATGSSNTNVTLNGTTQAISNGSENQYAAYLGTEVNFTLSDTASLDVSGKVLVGNNVRSATASATLTNKF